MSNSFKIIEPMSALVVSPRASARPSLSTQNVATSRKSRIFRHEEISVTPTTTRVSRKDPFDKILNRALESNLNTIIQPKGNATRKSSRKKNSS